AVVSAGGSGQGLLRETGSGGGVTLGRALAVNQPRLGQLSDNPRAPVVNTGTINAGATSGYLNLRGNGSFTNQGTISVTNGDDFDVGSGLAFSNTGTIALASGGKLHLRDNLATGALGTISNTGGTVFIDGTLTNTGSVLATGSAGVGTVVVTSGGTIVGGTITGSGILGQHGTLSGVSNQGTLD